MGNKNMILLIGIILLWFIVIRPLTRKKESEESGTATSNGVSVSDNIQTYDRATEPNFVAGLNRNYTV